MELQVLSSVPFQIWDLGRYLRPDGRRTKKRIRIEVKFKLLYFLRAWKKNVCSVCLFVSVSAGAEGWWSLKGDKVELFLDFLVKTFSLGAEIGRVRVRLGGGVGARGLAKVILYVGEAAPTTNEGHY